MGDLYQETRHALRSLARSPVVTAVALAALALGIGANTAIFSVVYGLLLEPLPYPEPERLVALVDHNLEAGFPRFSTSPPDFVDWQEQSTVFDRLAAFARSDFAWTRAGSEPELLLGASVTAGYFDLFGLPPYLGRVFTAEDDRPGAAAVAVLSHQAWQRRFGGDPRIVGSTLTLDGRPCTVVGVAAPGFAFPHRRDPAERTEVWVPFALEITDQMRGGHWWRAYGRLRPGVTLESAQVEMDTITRRLEERYPESNTGWGVRLHRLSDLLVEDVRPALLMLTGAVALVLLIACANVANVLLARYAARQREVAIRSALGAGRGRLLRQFLAESLLLALGGGALGLVLASWGTRVLLALHPEALPSGFEVGIEGPVLGFTLALSAVTGILFGLLPALHASRTSLQGALREGGQGPAGGGRDARFTRGALVLLELALAVVLLVGAGLLLRSFVGLQRVSPGFDPEGVLSLHLNLPESSYGEEVQQIAFYERLIPELEALPAVEQAGAAFPLPLSGNNFILAFFRRGEPIPEPGQVPSASVRFVTPGYFRTLRIPLLRGRGLSAADRRDAPEVALINQTMARRLWGDGEPLGQRLTFDDPQSEEARWAEVVGVVADVRHRSLALEPEMEIYLPLAQFPFGRGAVVLRGGGDPARLAAPARRVLQRLDPGLPAHRVEPLETLLDRSLASERFTTALVGLFALVALLLAAVGVYGVISYSVARRTREIGVRLTLGASRRGVLRLVVGQGMVPVALGILCGLLAAPLGTRLLGGLLYGVGTTDPWTFAAVPLLLATVALAATVLPARRATRVDPLEALREE